MSDRVQLSHPDPEKSMPTLEREVYEAFRNAILKAVPADEEGIPFQELPAAAEAADPAITDMVNSVGWHVTTIKLHMEAIGDIERVPKASPQRLRRKV